MLLNAVMGVLICYLIVKEVVAMILILFLTDFRQIPRSRLEVTFWHMRQLHASVYAKVAVKFVLLRSTTGAHFLLTYCTFFF